MSHEHEHHDPRGGSPGALPGRLRDLVGGPMHVFQKTVVEFP